MKRIAVLVALVALLAGCGGGGGNASHVDQGKLQSQIQVQTNLHLLAQNISTRVTTVACVKDGTDDKTFVCSVSFDDGENGTVKATCDDTGGCVWRLE